MENADSSARLRNTMCGTVEVANAAHHKPIAPENADKAKCQRRSPVRSECTPTRTNGHCGRYVWNGREQANTEITCFRNIVDQIRQPQTQTVGASSRAEINNNEKPYFPVCESGKNFTGRRPETGFLFSAQNFDQARAFSIVQPIPGFRIICKKSEYENPKQHGRQTLDQEQPLPSADMLRMQSQ